MARVRRRLRGSFCPRLRLGIFSTPICWPPGFPRFVLKLWPHARPRLLLSRWREVLAVRQDFGFESTLSGRTYATMLRHGRERGYSVRLCYLWLPNAKICLRRVRQRVRKGGHDVPETDVRRRFLPSLRNFFTLYLPLADEALLLDGAFEPPQLIARWDGKEAEILKPDIYEGIQKQADRAKAS